MVDEKRMLLRVGSTFRWTEGYGAPVPHPRERARDVVFAVALLMLAAGAAGFVTFDPPTGRASLAAVLSSL